MTYLSPILGVDENTFRVILSVFLSRKDEAKMAKSRCLIARTTQQSSIKCIFVCTCTGH